MDAGRRLFKSRVARPPMRQEQPTCCCAKATTLRSQTLGVGLRPSRTGPEKTIANAEDLLPHHYDIADGPAVRGEYEGATSGSIHYLSPRSSLQPEAEAFTRKLCQSIVAAQDVATCSDSTKP